MLRRAGVYVDDEALARITSVGDFLHELGSMRLEVTAAGFAAYQGLVGDVRALDPNLSDGPAFRNELLGEREQRLALEDELGALQMWMNTHSKGPADAAEREIKGARMTELLDLLRSG